ncbi:hypothetical protein [Ohtaekwangia koreensis]|uniref:AbiTii domain-containing protein n=1 Tax=Ohtaekwangia koreensis TaxID=688867 RepID=A0A1T5KQK3_9BACT|nr:hypothetical protein [Ohtaekwangia koreensis]SKC65755.1 hypothetical protein SAMN05660236_2452 [Ohtaekwangia koreensis]
MEPIKDVEYQYLLRLLKDDFDKKWLYELLRHSEIAIGSKMAFTGGSRKDLFTLYVSVDPEIFAKYFRLVTHGKSDLAALYQQMTTINIYKVEMFPDLGKYQIIHNDIVPAVTPWEEINNLQLKLIEDLRKAAETVDLQNIGNTSRTIMQKISSLIFDPAKHIPPEGVKVSEGMFKNRIATYIASELNTSQDRELRDYARAIIESTDKVIDLSNQVTHDLKTKNLYAECCVIGVVTTLSLLRVINAKRSS